MDLGEYVGLPYKLHGRSMDGIDCWGLVRLVYFDRLGITLPSYSEEYDDTVDTDSRAVAVEKNIMSKWVRGESPQPYDIAVLKQLGKPQHVGIIQDGAYMLHASPAAGSVLERYKSPRWATNFVGVYRL